MDDAASLFTQWAHFLLMWIGFGTLVGLIAKALLPGKDPGGAFATVFIGIFGSVIGASTFFFFSGLKVTPISTAGFATALVGTTLLLITYRVMHGKGIANRVAMFKWKRTRRRVSVVEE